MMSLVKELVNYATVEIAPLANTIEDTNSEQIQPSPANDAPESIASTEHVENTTSDSITIDNEVKPETLNTHEEAQYLQSSDTITANDFDINSDLASQMQAIEQQASSLVDSRPYDEALPLASANEAEHKATDSTADAIPNIINNTDGVDLVQSSETNNAQEKPFVSSVAAAIATRNMLRSRKKSLEDGAKKPSDAVLRPALSSVEETNETIISTEQEPSNPVELAAVPEQPYREDFIDPATIRLAHQVDKWAHMIDSMSLIARLRQLAIHATIDEASTDDLLILQLDQSIRHLNSDAAHKQLEARISEYLQRKVTVELNIVEKTVADPYQIQSDINAKRYEYAQQVLANDEVVIALQQQFQAELVQETIVAR